MIREISLYLPNTPGQFARVLTAVAEANVNIRGFSVDLSGAYSKVHLLFEDVEKAKAQLELWGYEIEETNVFALSMVDRPGELLRVAGLLGSRDVNIEYGYVTLGPEAGEALVVLKTDKVDLAKGLLAEKGIKDHDKIPHAPPKRSVKR